MVLMSQRLSLVDDNDGVVSNHCHPDVPSLLFNSSGVWGL